MPRCKHCKEKFEQYEFNNKYCKDIDCQTAKAMDNLNKMKLQKEKAWKKEKKDRKEKLKTWEDYYQEALKEFNAFIRLRDQNKPCISCNAPAGTYKITSGHYYPQGTYRNLGLDEDNAHSQCWWNCNKNKHGNLAEYRIGLIKKIGINAVEALDKRRLEPKNYSIPELIELKIKYRDKVKQLKQKS